MSRVRYDLHLHTEFSPDSDTHLDAIEKHALAQGLTGLAVTDHDAIEGALRLRERVKALHVIVGEEVTSKDGDVIGLFLRERIPPGMSALETMQAIHAQGGLVYLPHPFDKPRARKTGGASLLSVLPEVDIIETFNGKVGRDHYNLYASEFARKHDKIGGGGSDAHHLHAIGTVANEFDAPADLDDPAQFLQALASAHITGKRRSKLGGWLVRGRRPLSLAWRRLRYGKS
ncbi:MAG TPA: PHP-associated domain-containing protein [Chthonomonadaceae bacterium]|nr:PHP-associated domain-containing protein [Chthonomonadaceae bacterium]